MTKDEALKMALEALETVRPYEVVDYEPLDKAIKALRQILTKPEQHAIDWHHPECDGACLACLIEEVVKTEFGLSGLNYLLKRLNQSDVPDATKWVDELRGDEPDVRKNRITEFQGLTDEEINAIAPLLDETVVNWGVLEFAHAIEAKLKGKNT